MERRKQLTFDIDTNVTKEILGENNYTTIYSNIRNFMEKEGWIHIEGSVYMSSKPLSNTKVAMLINELKKEYPYIIKCVRNMHQSDITNVHSLEYQFEYDGTAGKFAHKENDKQESQERKEASPAKKMSLKSVIDRNKEIVKQRQADRQRQNPHKSSEYER